MEVDFDAAVAAYKEDIEMDIADYKAQEYVAPKWVQEALGTDKRAPSRTSYN